MPDTRVTSERDRSHASRARRREAALVAQYIHELSDRHNGSGHGTRAGLDGEPAGDGRHREEGG